MKKKRIKPSEGNKTFCVVPWTHTYISPQSERRMCCASREKASWATQYIDGDVADVNSDYSPITLEEHWNSDYMNDIRKRLMAGEEISQCDVCNNKLLNIHVYRDYFTKTLFPHKIDEIFENTDDEGKTTLKPISYDYRINNLCNFKCRMCGDQLSSQWEKENRELGYYDNGVDAWASDLYKPLIGNFQKTVVEKELWDAVYEKRIEEIYWVGGEPLMWDIHWDIMSYLVENDQAKDVVVRYNTNLSMVERRKVKLYDLLQHFKRVQICASIDGVGKIGEYIRTGLRWDSWINNFKKGLFLNEKYGDYGISFDLTVTSPGLFSIKDMIDVTMELDVHTLIKTTFSFDSTIIMSPMMIPRHILDPILDDIIDYATEKAKVNSKIQNYVDCFLDIKSKKTFEEEYDDWEEGIRNGKKQMEKTDMYRNNPDTLNEIFSENEELIKWWKSI
jgi:hypothetical protein